MLCQEVNLLENKWLKMLSFSKEVVGFLLEMTQNGTKKAVDILLKKMLRAFGTPVSVSRHSPILRPYGLVRGL